MRCGLCEAACNRLLYLLQADLIEFLLQMFPEHLGRVDERFECHFRIGPRLQRNDGSNECLEKPIAQLAALRRWLHRSLLGQGSDQRGAEHNSTTWPSGSVTNTCR